MLSWIDGYLNKVTMYRIVLYELLVLLGFSVVYATVGFIHYSALAILFSTLFITLVSLGANVVCARVFKATTNAESAYITALILALIIAPPSSPTDGAYFSLAIWAAIWAMAVKYVLAIRNKHVFNPAAFAVALTALAFGQSANWWVATPSMLPVVLIGGFLVTRKIRRNDLVGSFLAAVLLSIAASAIVQGVAIGPFVLKALVQTPILFFATVMLTEPLTTPPTRTLRFWYGAIVGFLFAPWVHVGSLYSTPELALLVGNAFSYAVSPKQKLLLTLKEKVTTANQTMDFVFSSDRPMPFAPGQYLEWTLGHDHPDSRGNRRYFTIASAPTEEDIRLGVKFYPNGSSFKNALATMSVGDTLVASQLTGDFVLPKDPGEKLAFIAGGIGVTPFRSMIKDLVDRNETRSVVMLYANKTREDIAYADVFQDAKAVGVRTINVVADPKAVPADWSGRTGQIDEAMIRADVPDFLDRRWYLSGPHGMVVAFDKTLRRMGVRKSKIKKDFFPGFA